MSEIDDGDIEPIHLHPRKEHRIDMSKVKTLEDVILIISELDLHVTEGSDAYNKLKPLLEVSDELV